MLPNKIVHVVLFNFVSIWVAVRSLKWAHCPIFLACRCILQMSNYMRVWFLTQRQRHEYAVMWLPPSNFWPKNFRTNNPTPSMLAKTASTNHKSKTYVLKFWISGKYFSRTNSNKVPQGPLQQLYNFAINSRSFKEVDKASTF